MGDAVEKIYVQEKKIKKSKIKDYVLTRRTPELVMGFCGAAGSGVSTVSKVLKEKIEKSPYNYKVEIIKISKGIDLLKDCLAKKVDVSWANGFEKEGLRFAELQEYGNALRSEFTTDVLSQYAICKILDIRSRDYLSEDEKKDITEDSLPKVKKRILWIIDSLKNPDEIDALRYVYGKMFFQIGVLCPNDKRTKRLEFKQMSKKEASLIIEKDKSESVQSGQQLIKTIQRSDFFVKNSSDNKKDIEKEIDRFVKLIFGGIETPTRQEYAMYVAQSAAYSSGCLSRQVGSSIIDEDGNVISYGCNDAPKYGGGLYSGGDEPDNRCFNNHDMTCQNSKRKKLIIDKLKLKMDDFVSEVKKKSKDKELIDYFKKFNLDSFVDELSSYSGIKDITEYSRAVHAEMDALIKLSRKAGRGARGCSMFVTTYPCHNCAKHIIASGIDKVYYIEPYEKSLAYELHSDAIALDFEESKDKVKFIPFQGVSPRRYPEFFMQHGDRKAEGIRTAEEARDQLPISDKFIDSYDFYETKAIQALKEMHLYSKVSGTNGG